MTADPPPTTLGSGPAPTRIGNAERQQAMDALDVHMSAGRLDPDEYGERVAQASVARTTADLEPLFIDLPAPHATSATASSAQARPAQIPPPPAPPRRGHSDHGRDHGRDHRRNHGREPLGGRLGEVAVGVSPFLATGLFFLTGAWVFFLLIPLAGVIVYGHNRDDCG
jgi:hypothetical protein